MSVLVKGMKMPKDCVSCRWHARWGCEITHLVTNIAQRCPLVEVPTPHGRLIDADGIDRAFSDSRWEDGDWRTGKLKHWGDRPDWCLTGAEVERLITAAPTIIEAEEGSHD